MRWMDWDKLIKIIDSEKFKEIADKGFEYFLPKFNYALWWQGEITLIDIMRYDELVEISNIEPVCTFRKKS